jgi:hypothetical protein
VIARLIVVFNGFGQLGSIFKKRFSDGDDVHNFRSSKENAPPAVKRAPLQIFVLFGKTIFP